MIGPQKSKPSFNKSAMAFALTAMIATSGCAYFNTYYNAQKLYRKASKNHRQFPDTTMTTASEKEDLKKAIDKYADVALKYPNSRWVLPSLYNMGNSYYLRGEYDKASRKYLEIWQYYPDSKYSARAQLNNAQISYNIRQWDKALWEISQIKTTDRDVVQKASYLEALILQRMPDYAKATIAWERFLFQHYKGALVLSARYNYATCLMASGEYANAIRELKLILGSKPKKDFRYQVSMMLGQAQQRNDQPAEALAIYRGLLKRESDKDRISRIEFEMANCLSAKIQFFKAIENYAALSAKYPKTDVSSRALFEIARIYEAHQELDSALAYYNKVRTENPSPDIKETSLKKSADISLLLAYRQQADQQTSEQGAALLFLMAEHYLFALNQPDSAISTFYKVATNFPDQPVAPKAWYAAAWTVRKYFADTVRSDSLFTALLDRYPNTRYANGARQAMNLPIDTTVVDSEPKIEMNLKPAVTPVQEPRNAEPDSTASPVQEDVKPESPVLPKIPAPDINRSNMIR